MPDNAPKPQPELMKALGSLLKGTEYAPNAPSPSDVAPLADAEVPKWLYEDELLVWNAVKHLHGEVTKSYRTIASLRAALARAAEENAEWRARDTADIDAAADADKARREARKLHEALRELYNVFPVVPIHDVDRHARIANAMDKARRLLGGEGA